MILSVYYYFFTESPSKMRKPRSKLANLFSFNQHRKRFGSKSITKELKNINFNEIKTRIIDSGTPTITYGSEKELKLHIDNLRREFSGQPEINFYHAKLIVLIRRGIDPTEHFKDFQILWNRERDFLLKSLTTRWLISAADTFIDFSNDELLQATLMNAVILVNTIKLQESERYLLNIDDSTIIDPKRYESLRTERLALFDGVSGFAVGTDDTLRNMRWRLDKICSHHPLGALVSEVFERVQFEGNVYARFKAMHIREKTSWWKN